MKKSILWMGVCLLGVVSCGGNSDRNNIANYDTAATDTVVYSEDSTVFVEEAPDETTLARQKLEELKSLPELQNYKALYEVKDKAGQIFNIYFTKDDSAIITSGSGNIYYCTLSDYTSLGDGYYIDSTDEAVPIEYEGGKININYNMVLKDNWLYGKIDYAKSNNPKWRLPVTLKGGSMRSENKKSESRSQRSGSSNEEQLTEEELQALETITYGYNEAAWRAKRRAAARGE